MLTVKTVECYIFCHFDRYFISQKILPQTAFPPWINEFYINFHGELNQNTLLNEITSVQ